MKQYRAPAHALVARNFTEVITSCFSREEFNRGFAPGKGDNKMKKVLIVLSVLLALNLLKRSLGKL